MKECLYTRGIGMPGEKRFGSSFMGGFRKTDVNSYIEKILMEFDEKLKEKDSETVVLKNQIKELRTKYEELYRKADQINDDRAKIAEVLIKAQEKAHLMIEDARHEALQEKKKLDEMIEQEKSKLVDIKKEMKFLKTEVVNTLKKYESQLGGIIKEDDSAAS
jgi:chromosome segregation ATPase